MNIVNVSRDKLLEKVRANRENHRDEFLKALDGFKASVLEALEARIELAKKGKKINQYLGLPEPADHTKDYDRIISMLEMSVDSNVEITEQQYAWYVLDDWGWKEQFTTTNAMYAGKSFRSQ